MAGASRRAYGEDGIYFDHRGDCKDSTHHRTCAGRWRGVVSLGFDADGKRIRKKPAAVVHSSIGSGQRTFGHFRPVDVYCGRDLSG